MTRWLLLRLLWLSSTLIGVTFVTFLVLDRAPIDRAELEAGRRRVAGAHSGAVYVDEAARDRAVQQLRVRYGLVDPETGEAAPLWRRYVAWLGSAATLQLAGPGDDERAFWRRLSEAVPVTLLLGGLSLLVVFGVGLPVGTWLGRRVGRHRERIASTVLLVALGVPQFLLATLLLLAFTSVWVQWFPPTGLSSLGSEGDPWFARLLDRAWHLVLPVTVMSLAPFVMVTRFVRDAVARADRAPHTVCLRALGVHERVVARRLLRHGATPAATLAGGLLPMLVGGSIVVENVFSLDGLGHLAFQAVIDQDQALVMALVLLTSVVTLLSLFVSDLLHRLVDPRVRLVDG